MLLVVESKKPLDQLLADLEQSITRHNFGLLAVHDLRAKLGEKGVPLACECRIYEVCNPHQAHRVLERGIEVSTALPCRIAVYEEAGALRLATIKPTDMLALFSQPELETVAEEVEASLVTIMADAAR